MFHSQDFCACSQLQTPRGEPKTAELGLSEHLNLLSYRKSRARQKERIFPSRMVLSLRLVFNLGTPLGKASRKSPFPAFGAGQEPQGINTELETMGKKQSESDDNHEGRNGSFSAEFLTSQGRGSTRPQPCSALQMYQQFVNLVPWITPSFLEPV